ncbi:hypothetical protein [Lutibacter profundi]|uniref:hypothetical protein n=1 Tax=Lutibacter profundi TaxID=1622118 RepID=UPI0011874024|nr:hypothetical protein [Lutibacter profundi]
MMTHYVTPISQAIRRLDNNSYPIEYYYGFGWSGLERYGILNNLLTVQEQEYNESLKNNVNINSTYGSNCN